MIRHEDDERSREALLEDLRSEDAARRNRAAARLTELLKGHARAQLGRRARQVNIQATSVVQSVLAHELDQVGDRCQGETHVVRYLRRAIVNKIKDRLRKGGEKGEPAHVGQMGPEDGPAQPDPPARQPAPDSEVAEWEGLLMGEQAFAQFRDRLLVGLGEVDRVLVERYILAGEPWAQAAAAAGIEEPAARQRLSRKRKALLTAAVEPLRERVNGEQWALIEHLIVQRTDPAKLAPILGRSEQQLLRRSERIINGTVMLVLGADGSSALVRLMARG